MKKLKLIFASLAISFAVSNTKAQNFSYSLSNTTDNYTDLVSPYRNYILRYTIDGEKKYLKQPIKITVGMVLIKGVI